VPAAQLRAQAGLGAAGPFSWTVGQPIPDNVLLSYARECRLLAALPERATTELQALRIGAGAIAALPGEIFVELGLALKGDSPFGAEQGATMVVGLANDYVGYVGTRKAIAEEGSYETWAARSALPAAGEGERMIAAAGTLLADLADPTAPTAPRSP
jgi:neutral ceramidase